MAQVMSFQHPGVCQFLHLLGDTASPAPIPGKPLQPWHRDGFSPPAAEFPLPVPTLTGFVICPQKCCPNLSFLPGKSQHTDLTPGLFHLASDPAPLTFSSFSMLACLPGFPWPSCHFHLLLVPAEPDLLWGQLGWMGTSGVSSSWAEAQLHLENTFPLNIKGDIFQILTARQQTFH